MSNQKPSARASAGHTATGPVVFPGLAGNAPDREPIPFAYALVEGPPGKWSAVLLEGVTARSAVPLEVNGQPEPQARAMMRAISAIERRTIAKKWGRP